MDILVKHLQVFLHPCSERRARPVAPLIIYEDVQFLRQPSPKRQLSFNILRRGPRI